MHESATAEYTVAFLCLEMHCSPSELLKEDYNSIRNIISILSARAEKSQKERDLQERQQRLNRF